MTTQYPGVNVALDQWTNSLEFVPFYPIGFPGYSESQSSVMPIKEVAMMILMDTLTDKPDWHRKVFDDTIVQKWRDEARQQSEDGLYARILQDKLENGPPKPRSRIISDAAFDYCIEELRGKAAYFVKSGLIPTLDGPQDTVIKSDSFIDETLHRDLNKACSDLRQEQQDDIDWHPRSNDMVQDLIHPSMYHFVYDRSSFIQEEVVGVYNAMDFIGQGEPVKAVIETDTPLSRLSSNFRDVNLEYWSRKYQWLPANVGFRNDGSAKFTSYVNNLHPAKFPHIYKTLERAIDRAIPAWDQCLREIVNWNEQNIVGRKQSRFKWIHYSCDENDDNWLPSFDMSFKDKDIHLTNSELEDLEQECSYLVDNPIETDQEEYDRRQNAGLPPLTPNVDDESLARANWEKVRDTKLPDPLPYESIDYTPKQSLRDKFWESGLQVIVKMASIELTPEKPEFSAGNWHLEGQMNEKIAATALYYFDSENVTSSRLSFRMQTSYDLQSYIETEQDSYNYVERVYGTLLGGYQGIAGSCNQSYGDVETKEGRLLAFPNVLRFVALWLVDPHQRIVSTANVPPQQKHWWARGKPSDDVPAGLMTEEEARQHRLELMDERTAEKVGASNHASGK
ncbi:hypothetical protein FHETE_577 [Fusarium heterosporum]|uniref:Uncharacterized protein n=1 Tax=Fusarium heterosporum TaxID=42747 RepID=A0A8H5TX88_FUSHE|nr:hypothetical protein FHETE_577 [Fusarium heterosporum]